MSENKKKRKYSALGILKIQNQYWMKVWETLAKVDWKKEDPAKVALEVPIYFKNVLEKYIELNEALFGELPKHKISTDNLRKPN